MASDECLAMLTHPKILKNEKYIEKTITLITLLHQHKKLMVY
jgi:hypothetical protein